MHAFESFIETGQFPAQPKYFGISPEDINQNYPFKPPAVFLALDWIARDPKNALDALVEEYKKPLPKSFLPQEYHEYMKNQKAE